jgi:hypothetical protein
VALAATSIGLGPGNLPTIEIGPVGAVGHGGTVVLVRGIAAAGDATVTLEGATDAHARPLPRVHLRRTHAAWRGTLPAPALAGSYPIVVESAGRRYSSPAWIFRAYPPSAAHGPTFATRRAAVRAWVASLPGDQVLVALRFWKQTAIDRRDRRFNALLVVAYAPRGDRRAADRRGIFLTLARDGPDGDWRILRATVAPY